MLVHQYITYCVHVTFKALIWAYATNRIGMYLGLFVDNNLSWDIHCDKLCRQISGKIAVLRRMRHFVKPHVLKLIYERTVQPEMDYACSIWCHTYDKNIEKLQRAQNYAARIITGNFDYINWRSITILRLLKWMTIKERCNYFTAMMMYKALNGLTPEYLSDTIVLAGEAHDRETRLTDSFDVYVPGYNSAMLKRSFIYNGSVLWNSLPLDIKNSVNIHTFKRNYKGKIIDPLFNG